MAAIKLEAKEGIGGSLTEPRSDAVSDKIMLEKIREGSEMWITDKGHERRVRK